MFHAQDGWTPLHCAARNNSSVAVVQALLAAYPEAATATMNVRIPSPLVAWMRGPERSSEVIICNQGQSVVIIRNQRRVSGEVGGADVRDRVLGRYAGRGALKTACRGPSERLWVPLSGSEWL